MHRFRTEYRSGKEGEKAKVRGKKRKLFSHFRTFPPDFFAGHRRCPSSLSFFCECRVRSSPSVVLTFPALAQGDKKTRKGEEGSKTFYASPFSLPSSSCESNSRGPRFLHFYSGWEKERMGGAGRGERQKGRRRRLSFYGFSSSSLLLFRDRFDLNYPPPSSFSRPTFCCQLTHVTATFSPALGRLREKSQTASTGGGGKLQHLPGPKQCRVISGFSSPLPPSSFRGPNSPCLQIIN